MREIHGDAKTVRELLKGVKYSIDYYQREYKWRDKQVRELIDDLTSKFLEEYQPSHQRKRVADYPHYFLGSIIVSKKDTNYIVDGQQRLTSLTLLLIYLRKLQNNRPDPVNVDELIVSERYGDQSFNLDVDERAPCMKALFDGEPFDASDRPESVQNIVRRFEDIDECFPDELRRKALPYFIDWLLENVHVVEISAYSDDDAYTIFETMNDRGLSLSPTDMLKGYLLANIADQPRRASANTLWRDRIRELNDAGKEVEADCFKSWFRGQYAQQIRERKKGAKPEDFDRIGTEFHRWLRDASAGIGLTESDDFCRFIDRNFEYYSRQYLRIIRASHEPVPGLEHVLYNSDHGFTLQNMLLMAPITSDDPDDVAILKQRLVARYVDILIAWRLWNFRSIAYSTMQYAMFLTMRDARRLDPRALAKKLHARLKAEKETISATGTNHRPGIGLFVHQQNRYALRRMLARITDYVEVSSGHPSRYTDFVSETATSRYEVEHIWANKPERHIAEFADPRDFQEHRNRFGGLLLLPKKFNASYGAMSYEDKLPHYLTQNVLAKSLHSQCYDHNPSFTSFVKSSKLPFHPCSTFTRKEIDERGELYRLIAERIWNPDDLLREVKA